MNTLLILHGWGSSSKNWNQVKELLENQGYKVFVPDLPGFGETPPPPQPWDLDDYVEWVRDFCEKNNLSQFFLLGHSFGGGIAIKFVHHFPEKTLKLLLVAPAFRRRKTLKQYLFLGLAKIGNLVFAIPGLSFSRPLARKILYIFAGTRDYYKIEQRKAVTLKETFKKIIEEDLTRYLSGIKIPTVVIWGAKDVVTPTNEAYLIKNEIKDARLEIVDDSRHGINLEKPERLAEIIIKFLKS